MICELCGRMTPIQENTADGICPDCKGQSIKRRTIKSLEWMTTQFKWQHDNEVAAMSDEGSQGGYSPELQEAIDLLEELKT